MTSNLSFPRPLQILMINYFWGALLTSKFITKSQQLCQYVKTCYSCEWPSLFSSTKSLLKHKCQPIITGNNKNGSSWQNELHSSFVRKTYLCCNTWIMFIEFFSNFCEVFTKRQFCFITKYKFQVTPP